MTVQLPDLPFAADALEPVISARTIALHHGQHHRTYVDNLNHLIAGTAYEALSVKDIRQSALQAEDTAIANNAGQHLAHALYWQSLSPVVTTPSGPLAARIVHDFGSAAAASTRLMEQATQHFGSGWAWLVWTGEKLAIETTANAGSPLDHGHHPLLAVDVWEHAHYLDWENRRAAHLEGLRPLLNWDSAGARYAALREA